MTFDVRRADLDRLNSMTKYPSIETYHALNPSGGMLMPDCQPFDGPVIVTEKIDGTNARVVLLPDGVYLIGSRENLLTARGDLVPNPNLGIVATLREEAERLVADASPDRITIFFFEVFGGNVTAASKQYTSQKQFSYRLFDVAHIDDYAEVLLRDPQQIAAWRDHGGQRWSGEEALADLAAARDLALTPRLHTTAAADLPTSLEETLAWLRGHCPATRAALDPAAGGNPEGVVIRTPDRARIAKLRFEDYERTLNPKKGRGRA